MICRITRSLALAAALVLAACTSPTGPARHHAPPARDEAPPTPPADTTAFGGFLGSGTR